MIERPRVNRLSPSTMTENMKNGGHIMSKKSNHLHAEFGGLRVG
jgi:hypothetical protein